VSGEQNESTGGQSIRATLAVLWLRRRLILTVTAAFVAVTVVLSS
jgi:uncharacterized protein involved in exopolysaccharide biosynthesis